MPAHQCLQTELRCGGPRASVTSRQLDDDLGTPDVIRSQQDHVVEQEIVGLRKYIGQEMPILAGGRAATAYRVALDSIRAISLSDLPILRAELEMLRSR